MASTELNYIEDLLAKGHTVKYYNYKNVKHSDSSAKSYTAAHKIIAIICVRCEANVTSYPVVSTMKDIDGNDWGYPQAGYTIKITGDTTYTVATGFYASYIHIIELMGD